MKLRLLVIFFIPLLCGCSGFRPLQLPSVKTHYQPQKTWYIPRVLNYQDIYYNVVVSKDLRFFDGCNGIIDLSIVMTDLFKIRLEQGICDKFYNLDEFLRIQTSNYSKIEFALEHLSERFNILSKGNRGCEFCLKISELCLKFSIFCRNMVEDIIVIDSGNYTDLEMSTRTARENEQYVKNWFELLNVVQSFLEENLGIFLDENIKILNVQEVSLLNQKLLANFSSAINRFYSEIDKNGLQEALKISFFGGEWLPVFVYFYINIDEVKKIMPPVSQDKQ